ncbi:MAG: protein kinase domain-containing protein, partial [Isosphaeraceae bacterium]
MEAQPAAHPSERTLRSYGSGQLDRAEADAVRRHLSQCGSCQSKVAGMKAEQDVNGMTTTWVRTGSTSSTNSSLDDLEGRLAGGALFAPASSLPAGLADHRDYQVLRELGRGGMGVVYLAENKLMGRKEVLKVVSSQLLNRQEVLERFQREIRAAALLRHPNIVTAYSASWIGESLVLAMEYVEGTDLAKLVEKKGPLPVAHACNFAYQAALGLQHAQEQGMVHRDIKPSNLMLSREGKKPVIKILDFGLAKVSSETGVDAGLTHEGQMLGTPHYISPEQMVNAQKADIRADIYSLGCTLYCLLSGHPPFDAPSLYELLQAHHSMDATPLYQVRADVPAQLAALVAKMMAKNPQDRFQTPMQVAQALAPFTRKAGHATTALETTIRIQDQGPGKVASGEQPRPSAAQSTLELKEGPPAPPTSPARSGRERRSLAMAGAAVLALGLIAASMMI